MGIFGSIFGKSRHEEENQKPRIPWILLESTEQLEKLKHDSNQKTQLIFKHSTTCGISRMVLGMFSDNFSNADAFDVYFLDLHAQRAISNVVAQKFNVVHQSPQLLIIKNGEVVYHTSHGAITEVDIKRFA